MPEKNENKNNPLFLPRQAPCEVVQFGLGCGEVVFSKSYIIILSCKLYGGLTMGWGQKATQDECMPN